MKNRTRNTCIAAMFAGLFVSAAGADVITGRYTSSFGKTMNINSPALNGDVNTVLFNWTRQDSPTMGVDTTIAQAFNTYCVDLSQNVQANTNFTFEVRTPAAHGFSGQQTSMLQRLWADHFPQVNSSNTSAAFQIAVWEIIHDDSFSLSSGVFKVNSNNAATTTASTWLSEISSPSYLTSNPLPDLAVLHSSTAQDQITVVPAPATGLMASIGLLALARGRSR